MAKYDLVILQCKECDYEYRTKVNRNNASKIYRGACPSCGVRGKWQLIRKEITDKITLPFRPEIS